MSAYLEVSICSKCPNYCKYCPKQLTEKKYTSDITQLSLKNYIMAIDKLPSKSKIIFAGFSEPAVNQDMCDMILYTHKTGHKVGLFTTLIGLSLEQYKRICEIPFSVFAIHLPDDRGKTRLRMTPEYLELLKYIVKNHKPKGLFEYVHLAGNLHKDIKDIVPKSILLPVYDRAANLTIDEPVIKKVIPKGEIRCTHGFLLPEGSGVLLPNGDIQLCCSDFGLEYKLGNLFTQSWAEIVNSETMKRVISGLSDNSINTLCRKCYFAKIIVNS